jgi:hypothetical protein
MVLVPTPEEIAAAQRAIEKRKADAAVPRSNEYGARAGNSCLATSPDLEVGQLVDAAANAFFQLMDVDDNEDRVVRAFFGSAVKACRWRYDSSESFGWIAHAVDNVDDDAFKVSTVTGFLEVAEDKALESSVRQNALWVAGAIIKELAYDVRLLRKGVKNLSKRLVNVIADLAEQSVRLDTVTAQEFSDMEQLDTACNVLDDISQTYGNNKAFTDLIASKCAELARSPSPRRRAVAVLLLMYSLEGTEEFLFPAKGDPTALGAGAAELVLRGINPSLERDTAVRFYSWRALTEIPLKCLRGRVNELLQSAAWSLRHQREEGALATANALEILAFVLKNVCTKSDTLSLPEVTQLSPTSRVPVVNSNREAVDTTLTDEEWSEDNESLANSDDSEDTAAAHELLPEMQGLDCNALARALLQSGMMLSELGWARTQAIALCEPLFQFNLTADTIAELVQVLVQVVTTDVAKCVPTDDPVTLRSLEGVHRQVLLSGIDPLRENYDNVRGTAIGALTFAVNAASKMLSAGQHVSLPSVVVPAVEAVLLVLRRGWILPGDGSSSRAAQFLFQAFHIAVRDNSIMSLVLPALPIVLAGCNLRISQEFVPVSQLSREETDHPQTETEIRVDSDNGGLESTYALSYRVANRVAFKRCCLQTLDLLAGYRSTILRPLAFDVTQTFLVNVIAELDGVGEDHQPPLEKLENDDENIVALSVNALERLLQTAAVAYDDRRATFLALRVVKGLPRVWSGAFSALLATAVRGITDLEIVRKWRRSVPLVPTRLWHCAAGAFGGVTADSPHLDGAEALALEILQSADVLLRTQLSRWIAQRYGRHASSSSSSSQDVASADAGDGGDGERSSSAYDTDEDEGEINSGGEDVDDPGNEVEHYDDDDDDDGSDDSEDSEYWNTRIDSELELMFRLSDIFHGPIRISRSCEVVGNIMRWASFAELHNLPRGEREAPFLPRMLRLGLMYPVANYFEPRFDCFRCTAARIAMVCCLSIVRASCSWCRLHALCIDECDRTRKLAQEQIALFEVTATDRRGAKGKKGGKRRTDGTSDSSFEFPKDGGFESSEKNITAYRIQDTIAELRLAVCCLNRLVRQMAVSTSESTDFGPPADFLAVLAKFDVANALLRFLRRSDLKALHPNRREVKSTAVNVCSLLVALGGGRVEYLQDYPLHSADLTPRPSDAAVPCLVPSYDYGAALAAVRPHLPAIADPDETETLHRDIVRWLCEPDDVANSGPAKRRVTAAPVVVRSGTIAALLPVSEADVVKRLKKALDHL